MRLSSRLSAAALLVAAACSDQPFVTDVPFRVTSVTPSPGASAFDRGAPIVVTFSEELDAASVTNAQAFKVERLAEDGSASAVSGDYAYGKSGEAPYAATFTPKAPADDARALPYSTRFRVTLSTQITRQRDGGRLATPVTFEFRTEDPPPLAVVRLEPHDAFTGFARTGTVKLTFSEPVDCAAFTGEGALAKLLETRDENTHWKNPDAPAAGSPVPGAWVCPALPSGDPRRLEGSCRSSTEGDTTDYCTLAFHYAADDETDPAKKLAKSLGLSSKLAFTMPGADGATPELSTLVHSARATRVAVGEGRFELHGALANTTAFTGRVVDPAPLALVATSPRQGDIVVAGADRLTALKLSFTEQVDCARLKDSVTVEETFDPKTVLDLELESAKRTVAGAWSCAGQTQDREDFGCGADGAKCTYTFTPEVPEGRATPFAFSSSVSVKLAGGAWAAAATRVESVRATSVAGQIPSDASFTFRIADPNAFGLAAASPSPLASGIPRDARLSFTFTEPPDCAALAAATLVEETPDAMVGGAKAPVAGTWACAALPAESKDAPGEIFRCTDAGNCTAVFTPDAPLEWSSRVDVTLKGGATTAAGEPVVRSARATERSGSLAQTASWTFRVADPPPLAVTVTGPANGSAGAPRASRITIAFSEPVDCASLRATAKVLEKKDATRGGAEATVTGAWACVDRPAETAANFGTVYACPTAEACRATFTAAAPFDWSSRVTVQLPGGAYPEPALASTRATSLGGRLAAPVSVSFDVEDPPALLLLSATPGAGSTGIAPDASITLRFAPDAGGVKCASLVPCTGSNDASCTLKVEEIADPLVGGTALGDESARAKAIVAGTLSCTDGADSVTFDAPDFALSSDVRVTLSGGPHGEAIESTLATTKDGQIPADVAYTFTVRAPPPLTLVSLVPSGGAKGVRKDTAIVATFDRAVACATAVDGTSVNVRQRSPALADATPRGSFQRTAGTVTCAGASVTFTPASPFELSTDVEVSLGTASVATSVRATDATSLGGFLQGPATATFRVEDPPHLTIVAVDPAGSPATRVSATSDVRVTFDRAVRCTTASSRFHLHDETVDAPVAGAVVCSNGTSVGPEVNGALVIFIPAEPLRVLHTFAVTVDAGIEAVGATQVGTETFGLLPQPFENSFHVTQEDLRIAATEPAGGSTGAPVAGTVVLRFNQDLAFSSLKPCAAGGATPPDCNVWVAPLSNPTKAGAIGLTALSFSNTTFAATFKPNDAAAAPHLRTNTTYRVHVDGGVTGPIGANGASRLPQAYEFDFTTATNNLIASVSPATGATNVSVASEICVDFTATVNDGSLRASSTNQVTLTYVDPFGRTSAVPLQSTPYTRNNTRGLTDNQVCLNVLPAPAPCFPGTRRLLYDTNYTLTVSTAVSVGGATLGSAYSTTFRTGTAPQIGGYSVRNSVLSEPLVANATEVPFNGAFTVSFTEDVTPATLSAANVSLLTWPALAPAPGTVTLTLDNATKPRAVTLSGAALAPDTEYALRVYGGTGGVTLADGRYLGDDFLVPFRTNPQAALSVPGLGTSLEGVSVLPIVSTRDLHLPSVNANTVYGQRAGARISGIVAQQAQQPRSVTYLPVPTWKVGAQHEVVTTTGVLDARGTPALAATFGPYLGETTPSMSSKKPTPAPICTTGACAVAPGPGPTPEDFTFVFTIPGTVRDSRMQMASYYAMPAASGTDGTISFETTGTGGCAAGTRLPIRVDPELGGTSNDKVRVTVVGPTYPKSGCGYALKIRQGQTANIFGIAPDTTSCTTTNLITPTEPISSAICTTSNLAPGIVYTGESTPPTLASAHVTSLGTMLPVLAGPTSGTGDVYGGTEVRLTFSEPVDPATISTSSVSLRTGATNGTAVTATVTPAGNVVVLKPAARLAANTDYFVMVGNQVKDLAGNTMIATNRQFRTENTAPSLVGATATKVPSRTAPYGLVTITFSEPVDPSTLLGNGQGGAGALSVRAGSTLLFGCLSVDKANPKVVTWAPDTAIAKDVVVTIDPNPANSTTKLTDYTGVQIPAPSTPVTVTWP